MTTLDHFELIIEAVGSDGVRIRLDAATHVPAMCTLCGRILIDDQGQIRASLATVNGTIRMVRQRPAGCGQ